MPEGRDRTHGPAPEGTSEDDGDAGRRLHCPLTADVLGIDPDARADEALPEREHDPGHRRPAGAPARLLGSLLRRPGTPVKVRAVGLQLREVVACACLAPRWCRAARACALRAPPRAVSAVTVPVAVLFGSLDVEGLLLVTHRRRA